MRPSKYPEYESMPFELPDITQGTKTTVSKPITIVDEGTGEMTRVTQLAERKQVWKDNANYIKMFPDGIDLINRCSTPGLTILGFILRRMKVGQYQFELKVSQVIKAHSNLAGGRYYEGLDDLLRHGYMVRKKGTKNTYFLNPNCFFNGDRKWVKQDI